MFWKSLAVTTSLLSASMLTPITAAAAETNVMVIFDASGSMKRSAGNESRIVAARRVVSDTLASMPATVRTGLLVYGHRRAKDCSDMEVVSPIGALTHGRRHAWCKGLTRSAKLRSQTRWIGRVSP